MATWGLTIEEVTTFVVLFLFMVLVSTFIFFKNFPVASLTLQDVPSASTELIFPVLGYKK